MKSKWRNIVKRWTTWISSSGTSYRCHGTILLYP